MEKRLFEPLNKDSITLNEMKRPSLTYWADAYRRFKKNKLSMISLIYIGLLILSVIIVPLLWNRSYEEQRLEFANIPPVIEVYDMGDGRFIYINNDYKIIIVSEDGELLEAPSSEQNDLINKQIRYVIDHKEVIVDYSVYIKALNEYKKLEKLAESDPTIDLVSAKQTLNSMKKYALQVDGEEISEYKSIKNQSYVLGTDALGRDFFIRLLYGGRISLTIAFVAALVNFIVGIAYGGISGYFGGWIDNLMMRIVDTISTIPLILYVIVLMVVLEPSLGTIIIALSLTYWVGMARIVRAQVLSLKDQEFVLAAKTIGASTPRILFRHIIPNTMGPIMVALTMQIPVAIFTEAFLSFIGLGISEPIPSWGALANDALKGFTIYPYLLLYPALIMSITLLAFNLLGDGLRDALDPRLRK